MVPYSEIDTLRENLIFSIISSSKGDITAFERLFIVTNLGYSAKTNQRWLVDLYMKCGCFSEAKNIYMELGHWRKLGDLAWIDGDITTAEKYYLKPEDRKSRVFRGSKDWDRLIKIAYSQSNWDKVINLFIEANIQPLDKKNIVLGSSSVSAKSYLKMIAFAFFKSNRLKDTILVKKIAKLFSVELTDFKKLIDSISVMSEDDLKKSQNKLLPKVTKIPFIDFENALKKGNTFKSNQIVSALKNIEKLLHDLQYSLQKYFEDKKISFLSTFSESINGFFDETIAKTFLTTLLSKAYDYIQNSSNFKEVINLYESHPLIRRMYFGELLKLKFENNIPVSSIDIYTGLLQSIFSVETDIAEFMNKNKKSVHLLDYDKFISYADWIQLKISNWFTESGKDILQNVVSTWNSDSALPVKTLFNSSEHKPNNPREMSEWKHLLQLCHKYITEYWEIEIGKDKWKSEKSLFEIIKKKFKGHEVVRHAQPLWLEPQHLDIFIPDFSIAIEYMGEQHYHPVDFFGGKQGYEATLRRDKRKIKLCKKVGIELVHIRYDDNIGLKIDEILLKTKI